jgi:hypothetical protein
MSELKDAVPVDVFTPMSGNVREEIIATTIPQFLKKKAKQVPSISLFIWDEMVHRRLVKEPFKIAPIINNDYKGIYEFVQTELGGEPIADVYSVEYFNDIIADESFVDVTLAQSFPEDIHVVDVELSDNRKPIFKSDPTREYRKYAGLHIFDEFIDRLKNVARDRGAKRISLLVAYPSLYKVFTRHGFRVSKTKMSQIAYEQAGRGYAMFLPIK